MDNYSEMAPLYEFCHAHWTCGTGEIDVKELPDAETYDPDLDGPPPEEIVVSLHCKGCGATLTRTVPASELVTSSEWRDLEREPNATRRRYLDRLCRDQPERTH